MVILLLLCYQNKLFRSMLSSHYSSKLASFFSKFFLSFANRKQSSGNNCSDESEDKTQTRVKSATYMIIKIKYYVPEIRAPIELSSKRLSYLAAAFVSGLVEVETQKSSLNRSQCLIWRRM